jgi:pimeloyl-[acyl-carrier protein] methyl ester esterase
MSPMRTLIFVHGWGFDASFWQPVAERLPEFARVFVDFGFRANAPHHPKIPGAIVVGHSMGFAWALANLPRPWAGAVAVNAFARFTRAPDFVSGVAPRMIERMQARFAEEPAAVTADFLTRCGVDQPNVDDIRPAPLGEALCWLAQCDERAAMRALDCPVQALAGTRDAIVPEAMSREAFAEVPLVLAEGADHLLPISHPEWVAGQIRLFAANLK